MNDRVDLPEPDIEARKNHHLDLCLDEDVEARVARTGLAGLRFDNHSLPELDLAAIDTRTTFLGKELSSPFVIGAMTGGTRRAGDINAMLAEAAQECGVGMGLGSQRVALEKPEALATYKSAARPPLRIGNLGLVQLNYGVTLEQIQRLVEASGLDALAFHLNPLQEAIQPEGDTSFSGLLAKLESVAAALSVPVIVKEVGAGISGRTAQQLIGAGITAIEVAGVGGTSWAAVEGFRGGDANRRVGEIFRDFGVPTTESIRACRVAGPSIDLLASGGVRSGLDGAKCIALGADAFAMSRPLLEASTGGVDQVVSLIESIKRELRIAMFCTASPNLAALRQQPLFVAA